MLNLEIVGEGATTKIYRDGDKAIKLYVNASPNEAENEAKLQTFAVDAGLPVPAVFGVRKIDDSMTALDMEYISGKPIIHEKMEKDERRNAIGILVELQCAVHAINTDGLPKLMDRLAWKITHSDFIAQPTKDNLLSLLNRLDDGSNKLCHGDFHPLNILYDGNKYWIIDWVDTTAGNPLADACRTYLIFKQFMMRSAGIYLSLFCKEAGVKQEEVLSWMPVVAAARLSENMDDKMRIQLLKTLDDWEQFSCKNAIPERS